MLESVDESYSLDRVRQPPGPLVDDDGPTSSSSARTTQKRRACTGRPRSRFSRPTRSFRARARRGRRRGCGRCAWPLVAPSRLRRNPRSGDDTPLESAEKEGARTGPHVRPAGTRLPKGLRSWSQRAPSSVSSSRSRLSPRSRASAAASSTACRDDAGHTEAVTGSRRRNDGSPLQPRLPAACSPGSGTCSPAAENQAQPPCATA